MDRFTFPFEKLEVWQLSVTFSDEVLELLASFPQNKHFRLIGQMEAAVTSIAQNIAEGKGRNHVKEFVQFLYIAQGSLFEVLTLMEIFKKRGLVKDEDYHLARAHAEIIYRKIRGLIKSLLSRKK